MEGMSITSQEELEGMRRAGRVVAEALAAGRRTVAPGVTPAEIDEVCAAVFRRHHAVSAPQVVYDAPCSVFVSVNAAIVHGLPSRRKLQPGDVVKIDVTPSLDGYVADGAITIVVTPAPEPALRLADCAREAFEQAMLGARAGRPLHDIGRAIERTVTSHGFSIVRELTGHGVGRTIHEPPDVPNYYRRQDRQPLREGLVIAVEPLIAAGLGRVGLAADGWTYATLDGSLTAHYEHTIVVTNDAPIILTAAA
jgi:methionyl aminopeptidase